MFPESFDIPVGLRALHRAVQCQFGHPHEPYKGWAAVKGDIEKEHGKKYGGIVAHKLVKGDFEIWYVDESHYNNVGSSSPAFVAFDKASIEALRKDLGGHLDTDTTVIVLLVNYAVGQWIARKGKENEAAQT